MLKHSMKMSGMHGEKIGIDDDEKGRDYIYGEKNKKIYVGGLINLDKPWCNMHNQWAYNIPTGKSSRYFKFSSKNNIKIIGNI